MTKETKVRQSQNAVSKNGTASETTASFVADISVPPFHTAAASPSRKHIPGNKSDEDASGSEHLDGGAAEAAPESGQPATQQAASFSTSDTANDGAGGRMVVADNSPNPAFAVGKADAAESFTVDASEAGTGWWFLGGLAVAAGGGVAATASGGRSGSGSTGTAVAGTVTDGPVQGAKVYYDVNGNGKYDAGTDTPVLDANGNQVVTDANGDFNFVATGDAANIKLVTHGGTDTVTGAAVTIDFSAPAGYRNFNPVTSLISAYMEANPGVSAAQAETAVETALGLPNLDYSAINLASPPDPATALEAQRAAAIIASAAIIVEQSGAGADAFQYLAANLGSGGSTDAIVSAVTSDPKVSGTDAARLADTVSAVESATSLDAIDNALVDNFFGETNVAPVFGDYTVSIAENSANGTAVQTVAATDADNDTLSYAITAGNSSGAFAINSATGAITVADATKLDFETTSRFTLTVEASDGTLTDTGTVTVNLTDTNDNTPAITSGATGSVAENAATNTVIYDAAATDGDAASTITYSLKSGIGDALLLNIDTSTGAVTLKNSANFEARPTYSFTVIASDGTNSSEQAVVVTVTDVNEPPMITSGGTGSVAENAATSTVVYNAAASDPDVGSAITYSLKTGTGDASLLTIDSATGAVTLNSPADFETKASYGFTVIANDGTNSSEQAVVVTVTDVNEPPVITSGGTGSVAENAVTSTVIYDAAASDPDVGSAITYSLKAGTGDASLLTIDSATGAVTLNSPADFETKASYGFTVIASDGTNSSEQAVTVSVTDVNEAPVIGSPNGGASVALNVAENTTENLDVDATDVDAAQTITYSLGGADASRFAIDPSTGVVAFAAAPDYETPTDVGADNIYNFTVTARDNGTGTLADTQDFAVTVTNVNEHVVVESSGAWIDDNANGLRDWEERTLADFDPATGNIDLSAVSGVIHYNEVPGGDVTLTGFGLDDRIEIDVQAFIANGHDALNILTRPNITTLDAFSGFGSNSVNNTSNGLIALTAASVQTGTRYYNSNYYSSISGSSTLSAAVKLSLRSIGTSRRLYFSSNSYNGSLSASVPWQLATGLPAGISLQDVVDFVNIPVVPAPVHVVVERDGAVIDIDGDGVRDAGENRLAEFGTGGSADLAAGAVIVHFNDAPASALNLTGFGTDDKIELDVAALRDNNLLSSTAASAGLASITLGGGDMRGYHFAMTSGPSSRQFGIRVNQHATVGGPSTSSDFGNTSYPGVYGMSFASIDTTINSRTQGLVAYWTDTGNALNNDGNLLPDLVTTPSSNQADVLANLNQNHYPGLVEFVWPVNVVIDATGAWIDENANGVKDAGDTVAADLATDLPATPVTLHFNGLPSAPVDLSGFGSDDRIVIDVNAMRSGSAVPLSSQTSFTVSSGSTRSDLSGFAGAYNSGSGSNSGVILAGSKLLFGHTSSSSYTVTGSKEGTIASDAGALAGHFDQVVFVVTPGGPI